MGKRIGLGIAVLLVLGGAGAWWWQQGGLPLIGQPKAPAAGAPTAGAGGGMPPVTVEATRVTVGPITRRIEAVGSLRSNESVVLRPEIPGRIAQILFEEGQPVKKGQMLVKLDDATYAAQVEQARANLALSEANNARASQLYARGAGTERARDEALATLRVQRAAIEVSRAALEKTAIMAPFDGIAGLRAVSVGAYVQSGQDLANLESVNPMKVDFRVPEQYLAALKVGQSLTIAVDAFANRSFAGKVYAIDPRVDEGGRAVVIRATVANDDGSLRPGLFARVSLILREVADAITVPEDAIVPRGEKSMIYKVIGDGFDVVPVRLGIRRGGTVEVVQGLSADDTVITTGHMKLRPGAKVRVAPADPKAGQTQAGDARR